METLKPIVFTGSMATAASLTEAIDLSGSYRRVTLEVPSTSGLFSIAGSPIWIQGSQDGTTFRRIAEVVENTGTAAIVDFQIVSNTSNRMIPLRLMGMRYLKMEISATVTASTLIFNVICGA